MKPMVSWKGAFAYITLGLLCGSYYFVVILYCLLIILMWSGSVLAGVVFLLLIMLSIIPVEYRPWAAFRYGFHFDIWREYFDFTMEITSLTKRKGERYMFLTFPHGIYPMGQLLGATMVREITPGHDIQGTGVSVIFMLPIIRHIMVWLGVVPLKRAHISRVFREGSHCMVIPGGIAEMFLTTNQDADEIYLKKRHNTIKIAIQEGADIVPVFFFGNTRIFHRIGSGIDAFMSKLSRKLRTSILFFYGRHFLPVPIRHPIRMVSGEIVRVKQADNPSTEQIQQTLDRVINATKSLHDEKKPDWETRSLVIS